mmetsp:Transcript_119485/g.283646  ORF Transcript_119485/g.283646 Transcript_119485/m.283646 type:complete len:315 (+) Transcript_119485:63-1007(+)
MMGGRRQSPKLSALSLLPFACAALLGRCLVAWSLQPDEEASLAFVGVHPQHRHVRVWLRAEDADEVAALLAQAEALRREAAQEEEEVKAARVQREASEAAEVKKAEDAFGSEIQVEVRPGEDPILAKARAELAAARANLAAAKLEAEAVAAGRQVTGQQDQPGSQPSVPPRVPVGKLEDVKLNLSGTLMTEDEWNDLAEKFEDMNLIEQFQTNSKLGSQGRRKLKALREGKKGGAFILPGERVRLLENDKAFRAAFGRFPAQSLNGYTAEKASRRGQECIIEKAYNDRTITCVFADGTRLDFPNEVVDGYSDIE